MLKPSLNKYNNQIHTTTRTTPNKAHNLDKNKSDTERKTQQKICKHKKGYYVEIFDKEKGNYISRKETKNQWNERKYKVILNEDNIMNNRYYKLDGISEKYNRYKLLLVD